MSDSSNVLDEWHHSLALQGPKIPSLQSPLTTPDDSNPSSILPATISLSLPRELVEHIFLFLDTECVLACRLINREFNEIIQTSTVLQYFLACKAAGVVDNPKSPLSYAERLEALKMREDAWRKLKPMFEMTIDGIHRPTDSSICRWTEGIHFLSDNNLKDLNYFHLTSFPQDNPRWIKIPGHGPALDWSGILVNFTTAIYEHDLIVNVISSDIGNQTDMERHSLDLVLLKFSTGEYHPLARRPRIHIQTSPEVEPWVVSRIVGDNLALIVHSEEGTFSDKLFIFDWKTGRKLLQHEASENAYYSCLVFVSPELLLVPNCVLSHFEVWHLPPYKPNPAPPMQILSLQTPAASSEYSLFHVTCHGEPNPFLHSMPYLPPRPFFLSPDNSIITANLRMSSNSRQDVSYALIVHRRALLDTIQKWTSPSLLGQQEEPPRWLTNEVTVRQIADPEDGSVGLDAQSKIVSAMPYPGSSPRACDSPTSPTFTTSYISANSGSSSVSSGLSAISSTSRCSFAQIPWAKWGPPISRWFQITETQALGYTVSNGQRYAFSDPNPLDGRKLMVSVADFNPHNFRRNEMMARLRSGEGENYGSVEGKEEEEEAEFEILDHKGVFLEEVNMGLKCVVYRAPDEHDLEVVLMDEERLFGVKLDYERNIESINVLHIG